MTTPAEHLALPFREGTAYGLRTPGDLSVDVAPAGMGLASAVISDGPFALAAGSDTTVVALGDPLLTNLALETLDDDRSGLNASLLRLQLMHAAPALAGVDLIDLSAPASPATWLDDATLAMSAVVDRAPGNFDFGLDTDLDGDVDLTYDVALPFEAPGSLLDVFITSDDQTPAGVALAILHPAGNVTVVEANEAVGCRYYVDQANGDDAAHGRSWGNAKATLTAALAELNPTFNPGVGPCDVWVAAGTYTPTPGSSRGGTFSVWNEVSLYGGFAGGESSLAARDPVANRTILSGEIGTAGDVSDNSYHVATTYADVRVDGVEVRGGNSDGLGTEAERNGGGIRALGSLTLANAVVADNRTGNGFDDEIGSSGGGFGGCGGGLWSGGGSLRIENSRFEDNLTGNGGASTQGGHGGDGGGVCVDLGSDLQVIDSVFVGNQTGAGGDGSMIGGYGGNGGGLYVTRHTGAVVIRGSRFEDNATGEGSNTGSTLLGARGFGGGMSIDFLASGSLQVYDSEVVANLARLAAGMHIGNTNSTEPSIMMNVIVRDNIADQSIGGIRIYLDGSAPFTLANSAIVNNEGGNDSGGLRYNPPTQEQGTELLQIVNTIIWGNTATDFPQIRANRGSFPQPRIDLNHVDLQGGCPDTSSQLFTCTQVVDVDPLFVSAATGDLHLQGTSTLIDGGDQTLMPDDLLDLDGDLMTSGDPWPFDFAGATRVTGGVVDLGPYEQP